MWTSLPTGLKAGIEVVCVSRNVILLVTCALLCVCMMCVRAEIFEYRLIHTSEAISAQDKAKEVELISEVRADPSLMCVTPPSCT